MILNLEFLSFPWISSSRITLHILKLMWKTESKWNTINALLFVTNFFNHMIFFLCHVLDIFSWQKKGGDLISFCIILFRSLVWLYSMNKLLYTSLTTTINSPHYIIQWAITVMWIPTFYILSYYSNVNPNIVYFELL